MAEPKAGGSTAPTGLRLQLFLARAGVASRRAAEELMREGRVTVNGQVVSRPGSRVDPERDHVRVDGRRIRGEEQHVYLVLNKPRGVVSTAADPEGRPTVLELVRSRGRRLYPVGRLDLQSEGLILLTNDGLLAQALLHPSSGVPRVYHVKVRGLPDPGVRRRLADGIELDGKPTQPLRLRILERLENSSWLEVRVREGRKHLVRDALAAVGHQVVKLKRVALGPLQLGDLPTGESRPLREDELAALRRLAGRQAARPAGSRPAPGERPRRAPRRR